MRKTLWLFLILPLLFTACTQQNGSVSENVSSVSAGSGSSKEAASEAAEPISGSYRVGLGSHVTLDRSSSATKDALDQDINGRAWADYTYCAVLLGPDGKIIDVRFDEMQVVVEFTPQGAVIMPEELQTQSKREQGDAYRMKRLSAIDREWYEQVDAFQAWMIGKSPEDVLDVPTKPAAFGARAEVADLIDLAATTTIGISDLLLALQDALEKTMPLESVDDLQRVVLAQTSWLAGDCRSAGTDGDSDDTAATGLVSMNTTFGAVLLDGEGRIAWIAFDAAQGDVAFDAQGQLVGSYTQPLQTKRERAHDYGLKEVSSLGLEWFEQVDGLEEVLLGRTLAEAQRIDNAAAADASIDVSAQATIGIDDFRKIVARCAEQLR